MLMDIQTNDLLKKRRAISRVIAKPIMLNKSVHSDGLAELKGHICYLRELNGRLKYMITEIHSLITNTL